MIRSGSASLIGALILIVGMVEPAVAQREKKPTQIDVVANDYAFLPLPTVISGGPTIFTFANQGKFFHEVNIVRLKPGATVAEFTKAEGPQRREMIERSVGILIAGPGNSPDGRILVNLVKGGTYVAYCQFRDTPEAPVHLMLGMYTSFTPR
jgi:hypothetical protein